MSKRRFVIIAAAVLGCYLAAAGATGALSGRHVLPLFEGIGPPPPYQWVNPPRPFATGNTKPAPASTDIAFKAGQSAQASAFTSDGQCVVNFNAGVFAVHTGDTSVRATITPLDPATLGPVPPGLAADGNAYRIELSYRPSSTPIDSITMPGSISLVAPNPGQVLLYSSDGQSWTKLTTDTVGTTSSVFSTFTRPGWYLVGASPTASVPGSHSNRLGTAAIAALVAGLAIVLGATPVAIRAIRRRRSRGGGDGSGEDAMPSAPPAVAPPGPPPPQRPPTPRRRR